MHFELNTEVSHLVFTGVYGNLKRRKAAWKPWKTLDFIVFLSCKDKQIQNMLHNKDIAKIEEIKGIFDRKWISPEYLSNHLGVLSGYAQNFSNQNETYSILS